MFWRLLWESFVRQRRRKALAGLAILLGTTAVTAMLALAISIGDRIHQELAVYGANIVVFPKADLLDVKLGGVDLKPATGGTYLHEADLAMLHGIFWANNITGVSPELSTTLARVSAQDGAVIDNVRTSGLWFGATFGSIHTGAPSLHPSWKVSGRWPATSGEAVLGVTLANALHTAVGQTVTLSTSSGSASGGPVKVVGLLNTGAEQDAELLLPLVAVQTLAGLPGAVSRVEISARTKPEDAFARKDPDALPAKQREVWYCRPYANSIAYQIREAMPGAQAEQVRRVEQSEGTVLKRISGLMWLVSSAALLAAGFAVSAAMATAVLERRREIGLMRSLGAGRAAIAALFYAETGVLAVLAGCVGYLAGSVMAWWLGAHIFAGDGAAPLLVGVLLPIVLGLALLVAFGGSTPSIRAALQMDPSAVLRADG